MRCTFSLEMQYVFVVIQVLFLQKSTKQEALFNPIRVLHTGTGLLGLESQGQATHSMQYSSSGMRSNRGLPYLPVRSTLPICILYWSTCACILTRTQNINIYRTQEKLVTYLIFCTQRGKIAIKKTVALYSDHFEAWTMYLSQINF